MWMYISSLADVATGWRDRLHVRLLYAKIMCRTHVAVARLCQSRCRKGSFSFLQILHCTVRNTEMPVSYCSHIHSTTTTISACNFGWSSGYLEGKSLLKLGTVPAGCRWLGKVHVTQVKVHHPWTLATPSRPRWIVLHTNFAPVIFSLLQHSTDICWFFTKKKNSALMKSNCNKSLVSVKHLKGSSNKQNSIA